MIGQPTPPLVLEGVDSLADASSDKMSSKYPYESTFDKMLTAYVESYKIVRDTGDLRTTVAEFMDEHGVKCSPRCLSAL